MTNVQLGIVVLGLLGIVAVLAFNWWQEKQIQKRIHSQFPSSDQDPLLGQTEQAQVEEFTFSEAAGVSALEPNSASSDKQHDEEMVDPLCETVFDINFMTPITGTNLIQVIKNFQVAGKKTIRFFAETADGFHRVRLHAKELYSSLQMAVQIDNYSGPLRSEEWDVAFQYADAIAAQFDGTVESADKEQVLQKATELDRLRESFSAQIALRLNLDGTQPVKAILGIAQRLGYVEYGSGHARLHDSGKPLFLLLLGGELSSEVRSAGVDFVELLIDVPNSYPVPDAFTNLVISAHKLAKALNATVVDEEGKIFRPQNPVIPDIDRQLQEIYDDLENNGFTAGSERASRLFS